MAFTNSSSKIHDNHYGTAEIVWAIIWFVIPLTVILANALTAITFATNRQFLKRSMYCLINLAVADTIAGLFTLISNTVILSVFGLDELIDKQFLYHRTTAVVIQTSVYYFCMTASMLSLLIVALERMVATHWPLRHRTLNTSAYVIIIALPWISSVGTSIFTILNNKSKRTYLGSPWIGLNTVTLCIVYIAIYIKVKSRQNLPETSPDQLTQQDKKLITTVLLVTIASICTWTPIGVVLLIRDINLVTVPYQAHYFATAIALVNSLVNPVIYLFRMTDFKKALKKQFFDSCCHSNGSLRTESQEMSVKGQCNLAVSVEISKRSSVVSGL